MGSTIWKLGILCFESAPLPQPTHSEGFNFIWLNEVIHLEQFEAIWKDGLST